MPGSEDRGSVIGSRSSSPHQLSRAFCSISSSKVLYDKEDIQNGQHHCSDVYQQNGKPTLISTVYLSHGSVELVPAKTLIDQNRTPAGSDKSSSRCRILTIRDRCDCMLNPQVFVQLNSSLGPLDKNLFASHLTYHLPQFHSWKPDPGQLLWMLSPRTGHRGRAMPIHHDVSYHSA